jgi:hypothetical protein
MDAYTPFSAVGAIVAGVVFLTVFFTLWGIASKKISGDKPAKSIIDIQFAELKNGSFNVHFKSGAKLEDVVLIGYCTTHNDVPYHFKQLLILRDKTGKRYYGCISEIQYLEEISNSNAPEEQS